MNITLEEAKAIPKRASEYGVPVGRVAYSHAADILAILFETENSKGTPSIASISVTDGVPNYKGPKIWKDKVLKAALEITGGNA